MVSKVAIEQGKSQGREMFCSSKFEAVCVEVEGEYRCSKGKSRDLPRGESHDSVNPAELRDDGSIEVLRDRRRVSQCREDGAMAMQGGRSRLWIRVEWENCLWRV